MHAMKNPVTMKNKSDMSAKRWCRYLVSVCYMAIGINLVTLIVVWYFFVYIKYDVDSVRYWIRYIILPSSGMLAVNILADFLVRSDRFSLIFKEYVALLLILFFCAFLCFVHTIVAVLFATFVVPVLVSTIFADVKLTRRIFILGQLLLIISGLRMHFVSVRPFGAWLGIVIVTASGLLTVSYFLAKVLIVYGQDNISNLSDVYHDKISLEEQLKLDPLTGLYNRKAYNEYLPQMMEECRLAAIPLSIAVLDIDDFKQVNDIYGHAAGDRVLLRLTGILKRNIPERIYTFRIGGEEFVLLFKDYSVADAVKICEEMLSMIRSASLPEVNYKEITFSCGVVGMGENQVDPVALFKAADEALYSAKNSGKNKIIALDTPI